MEFQILKKSRKISLRALQALLLLAMVAGCSLEKEVKIELPEYKQELVVECFLEPGKPFRMLLTESVGFTEGPDTPLVQGALVTISANGVTHTLSEGLMLEPLGFKIYNYFSTTVVPVDYTTEYELFVRSLDGREVTAKTRVFPPAPIRSMSYSYDADSNVSVTTRWPDFAGQRDYYQFALHKGTLYAPNSDDDRGLKLHFTLDDRIGDGEIFTIATLFSYKKGDTLIASVYHIDKPYWLYIQTADDAAGSNGNPFAQPASIISTVSGGIGVFTGFHVARDTVVIQ